MDEKTYRALDAINWSTLSAGRKSMRHLRHAIEHGREDSEAFAFGRAVHLLVLQPEVFSDQMAIIPACDRRTKAGKEEYAAWQKDLAGREEISMSDYLSAKKVADAVLGHSDAAALLDGAEREKPILWGDAVTGLKCKGRVDAIRDELVIDLKTSRDSSPRSFTSSVFRYGYHCQLAMYADGAACIDGKLRGAAIIAVETNDPFCVQIYRLSEEALLLGRQEYRRLLAMYEEAKRTDKWSGYADGEIILYPPPHLVEAVEVAAAETTVAEEPF